MTAQTVDITDLVENMRSSFVVWAVAHVFTAAILLPGFSWLGFPIVSFVFKGILGFAFKLVSESVVMSAFFLNTAIRKIGQATNYVAAVEAKNNLPPETSDADYEKAERNEIASFNSFVRVTE